MGDKEPAERKKESRIKVLATLWHLVIPFFRSPARKKAYSLLGLLLLLLFMVSGVNVLLSYIGRDFINALSEKKPDQFYGLLTEYLGGFLAATLIAVFYRYTEEQLALLWRQWMTQHLLKRYFYSRNYYKIRNRQEIDNPDQRISEDVRNFTATTLSLLLIILNSVITMIAFMGVLGSISTRLVVVLFIYAFFGTGLTIYIGKRLVRLHYRQYNREGNFRYGLIRIRDNAESIAFFRGEPRERIDLLQRFSGVYKNSMTLIGWNRNLGFLTNGYNYLALIVPTLVAAPLYLSGKIQFGVVAQAGGAFAQVLAALSVVITQFERISAYAAGVSRIDSLWNYLNASKIEDEEDDPEITVEEGKSLKINDLTVKPPGSSRILVSNLNLSINPGEGTLIMGESGVGKSSLLRTVAGLWNSGSGTISRPRLSEMMFLPQRPYMPIGTLRAQLVYPARKVAESDHKLIEILQKVNLHKVLERKTGGLDRQVEWANVLSLGEQQRVSFARLLYHNPKLAFLDEATSALDEENEALLYGLLRELKISYVSVGHRSALKNYHDRILNIKKGGAWDIEEIAGGKK